MHKSKCNAMRLVLALQKKSCIHILDGGFCVCVHFISFCPIRCLHHFVIFPVGILRCHFYEISTKIIFYYCFHIAIVCSIHLMSNSLKSIHFNIITAIQRHSVPVPFLCFHLHIFSIVSLDGCVELLSIEQSTTFFRHTIKFLCSMQFCYWHTQIFPDDKARCSIQNEKNICFSVVSCQWVFCFNLVFVPNAQRHYVQTQIIMKNHLYIGTESTKEICT